MFSQSLLLDVRSGLATCAFLICAASTAHALTWETTTRELSLDIGTAEVVVEFPYKNETSSPVTITDIKSGCECSAIERPEKAIRAGGEGVLTVRYKPGTNPGVRSVPIAVTTDQPRATATTLTIKATLEPVLKLDRVLLRWTKNSATDAQRITIGGTGRAPISSLKLVPAADTVVATLTPGDVTETWILSLAPVSTEKPLTVRVELQAEVRGQKITQAVFAVVR